MNGGTALAAAVLLLGSSARADWLTQIVAERPYCVTGVVTYVHSWLKCTANVVAPDDPNGPAVYVSGNLPGEKIGELTGCNALTVGDVVEIRGKGAELLLEPGLKAEAVRRIGSVDLPVPRETSWAELSTGAFNNRRVRVRGVLRSVTQTADHGRDLYLLTLGMSEGVLVLRTGVERDWEELVDAEISADGVVFPMINNRFEFVLPELETVGAGAVRVLRAPPPEIPEVRIDGAMSRRLKTFDRHRCRVIGAVTGRSADGHEFTIQRAGTALAVKCLAAAPTVGSCVEAIGFPQMEDDVAGLVAAEWRPSAEKIEAEPTELALDNFVRHPETANELYKVDLCNRLVRIRAALVSQPFPENGLLHLDLDCDGYIFAALLDSAASGDLAEKLRDEPSVEVTGVLHLVYARSARDARYRSLRQVEVRLRSPDDVKVLSDAGFRWRRFRRRFATVALWALLPLFGMIALQLYRLVHRRLRTRALLEDRRRIAHDLHDSIAQHMSGVKLLLDTVRDSASTLPAAQREALAMADGVLSEARRELRAAILDLQNDDLLLKTFRELLAGLAAEINASGKVRMRLKLRGLPAQLTPEVKRDLLAIVREAVSNALRHGGAKNVIVVSDPADGGGFTLGVWNDGAPFDAASAPGPEAGHFGLAGIRERALRCGFTAVFVEDGAVRGLRLEREKKR